jgi:dTDP-4-amino-4,6-dideoxygalactose transaminase
LSSGTTRSFLFWARNGLYHALKAFAVPRGARALLPAYICKAAVEPIAAYGLHVDFYGVRRDCSVDFADLEARICADTRVVLSAHYFGFPQKMEEFDRICGAHRLLLFEDCAHVLRGEYAGRALGSFGDASVFSYRKHLPMFDGAELLLRGVRPIGDRAGDRDSDRVAVGSRFAGAAGKHILGHALAGSQSVTARWSSRALEFAKKVAGRRNVAEVAADAGATGETVALRKTDAAAGTDTAKAQGVPVTVDNNTVSFERDLVNEPMTRASRWVLQHANVEKIARRRAENFALLREELRDIEGVTVLSDRSGEKVCPWVCPILIDGVADAHLALRSAGIPAVTWGGVRPEGIGAREYADADFLYDNLIFLPVHQNLSGAQLRFIAEEVKRVRAAAVSASREHVSVAS